MFSKLRLPNPTNAQSCGQYRICSYGQFCVGRFCAAKLQRCTVRSQLVFICHLTACVAITHAVENAERSKVPRLHTMILKRDGTKSEARQQL